MDAYPYNPATELAVSVALMDIPVLLAKGRTIICRHRSCTGDYVRVNADEFGELTFNEIAAQDWYLVKHRCHMSLTVKVTSMHDLDAIARKHMGKNIRVEVTEL